MSPCRRLIRRMSLRFRWSPRLSDPSKTTMYRYSPSEVGPTRSTRCPESVNDFSYCCVNDYPSQRARVRPQHGHCRWARATARAKRKRQVAIDQGMWRGIGASPARAEGGGYGRRLESSGVFFGAGQALQHQEPEGRDAQTGIMMEPSPVAPLEVAQAEFLFEFEVVALDAPTAHRGVNHRLPTHIGGDVAEPVVRGLIGIARPFDEQPLLGARPIAVRRGHAHPRKARAQARRSSRYQFRNRPIVPPPATPGCCCSPASMRFFRWCVPAVAATCASSPSSPTARPCAASSATAVSRPHHRASRPPAAAGGQRSRARSRR